MAEPPALAFGGVLRQCRVRAGMTQEELAEAAGISARSVSDVERGVHVTARRDTARLLAHALGLTGSLREEFEAIARARASQGLLSPQTGAESSTAVRAVRTLPRDAVSFAGREDELQRVTSMVSSRAVTGGAVSICAVGGMAGIGKTTFAVHVAHLLAPQFPDGQIFLQLHAHTRGQNPVEPSDALETLLLSIGVSREQIPESLHARAAMWRDRVAALRILLVLDDAEGHDQIRPLLPGSAGSLVVVTSRRRILALEDAARLPLAGLSPGEATSLLIQLADRPDLDLSDPAVGEIARLCGCLPLAIRLAAAQLGGHSAWTAADLAGELASRVGRVAVMRAENVSVFAALDMSYDRLLDNTQRLYCWLGLQPGADIGFHAAAALAGTDLLTARNLVQELYDWHLVDEPVHSRFRFHDLIRDHAASRAGSDADKENQAALRRLLDYYHSTARSAAVTFRERDPGSSLSSRASPDAADDFLEMPDVSRHASALAWLEAERLNLTSAISYAAAHQHRAAADGVSHALTQFAARQGYWDQTLAAQQAALEGARSADDREAEARILTDRAVLQLQKADFASADAQLAQALRLYRSLDDQAGEAEALMNVSIVRQLTDDPESGILTASRSLDLYCDLGDKFGQAEALICLCELRCKRRDYAAAAAAGEEALRLFTELGSRPGQAEALLDLSVAQEGTQGNAVAVAGFDRALALFRDLGDLRGEGTVLVNLGELHTALEDFPLAKASLEQAVAIFRKIGSQLGESKALGNLGCLHLRTGDLTGALRDLTAALTMFRRLGDRSFEAAALAMRGDVYRRMGKFDQALADLDRAIGLDPSNTRGSYIRSLVHRSYGHRAEAAEDLETAIEVVRERIRSASAYRYDAYNLAVYLAAAGTFEQANKQLARAIEEFPEPGLELEAVNDLRILAMDFGENAAEIDKLIELLEKRSSRRMDAIN
jgi:tetratricopeptide (TPR) repeat protein/transcriptional regulator with XRE-family HTH domain